MNKWKDKWFYYKFISTFLILGGLLTVYLYHMISQTWIRTLDYPFSFLLLQGQYLSFFTYQSNFIIGVWFLIAAIYHKQKNRLIDNANILLAVTAYISVTCFVYIVILFPGFFISKTEFELEDIITGPYFHILTLLLMIIYSIIYCKKLPFHYQEYYLKQFLFYFIYPLVYSIYLSLRIVIFMNVASLKHVPFIIVYPYLPITKSSGVVRDEILAGKLDNLFFIIIFFLVVQCLFVIFNYFYFMIFKKIAKRK